MRAATPNAHTAAGATACTAAGATACTAAGATARERELCVAAITLALLAGWLLRAFLFDAWPLREDEAIYAVWARAAWKDPWFLHTWPDKPPLFLWLQAFALYALGSTPAAARTVSLAASTATIVVVGDIARRLAGWKAGAITAWLMALSPFAISFGATGYTDSLLVFLGMLSLAFAVRNRPLAAGLALGAAIMTKQQGALYLPLVAGALWVTTRERGGRAGWLRLAAGVALVALPVLVWDAARWGAAPSPWDLGVRNYGALGLSSMSDWAERAQAWAALVWHMGASTMAWALLALLLVAALFVTRARAPQHLGRQLWWLFFAWSAGFLALHLVTTVPAWDRYLLPLAPMLAILAGAPAARLVASGLAGWAMALVAALLLWAPAWTAARGGLPIGGDHGAFAGLDEAMAWLEAQAEDGTIVYHNLLGWQARFALYDAVERGDVDLRWYPNATYLADNVAKSPRPAHYLVEPAWASARGLYPALAGRHLRMERVLRSGQIAVWQIVNEATGFCAWCRCVPPLRGGGEPARVPPAWIVVHPEARQSMSVAQ